MFFVVVGLRIPISPEFAPLFGFHKPLLKEAAEQLLLVFNLFPIPQVVGASWTLPLEVDMYLFLPCLFFFMRDVRKLWPLLVLLAFVMFWDVRFYADAPTVFPMCVPYFLSGVIAWQQSKRVRPSLPGWLFPMFLAALIGIAFNHTTQRRNWFFCLVLGFLLPRFRQMTWKPVVLASHYVAKYSYGVYLAHFTAIAVGFHYLAGHSLALRLPAYIVTLVLLPVLFYHLVEEPMIRLGNRLAKKIEDGPAPPVNEQTLHLEPAP